MKASAFLFLAFTSSQLSAQQIDTTFFENGNYCVFKRRFGGEPINPIAYYNSAGTFIYTACYQGNVLHGPMILYDEEGKKTELIHFKHGLMHGTQINYYPDGQLQAINPFRKGKVHGNATSYHPNGNLEWTKAYREGQFYGERILRDSTGALFNGEYTTYFPKGGGQYTTTCINGRPHAPFTVLRPDGETGYTGNYNNGFPDGEFIFFDKAGAVYRKDHYVMGKFQRSTQHGSKGGTTPASDP